MLNRVNVWVGALAVLYVGVQPAAQAMAVVDIRAIAQLKQQITMMTKHLSTAKDQLAEAKQTFQSLNGGRGMEQLLSGTVRNYLPASWTELDSAIRQGVGAYQALAADVQAAMNGNAILTAPQLALLSPAERQQLEAARRSAASLQVTARQALSETSNRFAAIQQLISAIPGAQEIGRAHV